MAKKANNSHPSKRDNAWWNNRFYTVLISVALVGGGCAFLIPLFITSYGPGDNVPGLRQAFLAITGGTLAILTLWETRRKNDQEHTRQVHAERRSRYATAIEQLADEKAPIRLGGVYTLAKLVDDWLDDEKTLPSMEKRRQEGQIIIDSLCAYIRSSFPLAERHDELTLSYEEYQQKYQDKNQVTQSVENSADNSMPKAKHQDNKQSSQSREEFVRDKSLFREEQEVRQTILSEIEKRLNGGEVKREDGKHEIKPGTWSYFEYDFLNTVFFYRVGFSNSYFGASSNFSGAKFTEFVDFSGAEFTDFADVWSADFSGAEFTEFVDFSGAEFTGLVNFSGAKFIKGNDFYWSADFSRAKLVEADFSGAEFTGLVNFSGAIFTWSADFSRAIFTWSADFSRAIFTRDAGFYGAAFIKSVIFSKATFQTDPIFVNIRRGKTYKARFSCKADPEDYNFKVSLNSPYKIETKEQEHNGIKFVIPEDAELFDPDEPSEQGNNDGN
ncbi:pentapeptide repeat-containing protein [Rothia aeria]|uniref:pentapeptide repeat-containing protein n=1 Tax=Rothia aeria TaxID=172042 RepID=UPI00244B053E|nr:pentapeptide repeat-containing protein [Rothia aeria]